MAQASPITMEPTASAFAPSPFPSASANVPSPFPTYIRDPREVLENLTAEGTVAASIILCLSAAYFLFVIYIVKEGISLQEKHHMLHQLLKGNVDDDDDDENGENNKKKKKKRKTLKNKDAASTALLSGSGAGGSGSGAVAGGGESSSSSSSALLPDQALSDEVLAAIPRRSIIEVTGRLRARSIIESMSVSIKDSSNEGGSGGGGGGGEVHNPLLLMSLTEAEDETIEVDEKQARLTAVAAAAATATLPARNDSSSSNDQSSNGEKLPIFDPQGELEGGELAARKLSEGTVTAATFKERENELRKMTILPLELELELGGIASLVPSSSSISSSQSKPEGEETESLLLLRSRTRSESNGEKEGKNKERKISDAEASSHAVATMTEEEIQELRYRQLLLADQEQQQQQEVALDLDLCDIVAAAAAAAGGEGEGGSVAAAVTGGIPFDSLASEQQSRDENDAVINVLHRVESFTSVQTSNTNDDEAASHASTALSIASFEEIAKAVESSEVMVRDSSFNDLEALTMDAGGGEAYVAQSLPKLEAAVEAPGNGSLLSSTLEHEEDAPVFIVSKSSTHAIAIDVAEEEQQQQQQVALSNFYSTSSEASTTPNAITTHVQQQQASSSSSSLSTLDMMEADLLGPSSVTSTTTTTIKTYTTAAGPSKAKKSSKGTLRSKKSVTATSSIWTPGDVDVVTWGKDGAVITSDGKVIKRKTRIVQALKVLRGTVIATSPLQQSAYLVLTSLNLTSCLINDKLCELVAAAIRVNSTITCIDLSGNFIEAAGCTLIAGALGALDVDSDLASDSNSEPRTPKGGGGGALSLLSSGSGKLTPPKNKINASNSSSSSSSSSSFGRSLTTSQQQSISLVSTSLISSSSAGSSGANTNGSSNGIGSSGYNSDKIHFLSNSSPKPGKRNNLSLTPPPYSSSSSSTAAGGGESFLVSPPSLPEPKKYNTTLQKLVLAGNGIGAAGAKALAQALCSNNSLTYLDVGFQTKGKKIGPDGATSFACLLHTRPGEVFISNLQTLRLPRNNICFEGCRHLASSLLNNATLTELDIGGINYITIAGSMQLGQAIALAAKRQSRLQWLTVGEHRIPISVIIGDRWIYNHSADANGFVGGDAVGWVGGGGGGEMATTKEMLAFTKKWQSVYPKELKVERTTPLHAREEKSKAFTEYTQHGMHDELAVVVATLLLKNRSLERLCLESAYLPVQKLHGLGHDAPRTLDLSNQKLTTVDTIIIGSLIADNSRLRLINLRDNCFANTEGENFIAYALERNPSLGLNTQRWPIERMYHDGYKALASIMGMSSSGARIEPQRLEGWFYRGITAWSGFLFYYNLGSDLQTINVFATTPDVYRYEWTVIAAMLLVLPTALYSFTLLSNHLYMDPQMALYEVMLVVLQITPGLQAYECVVSACETTSYLDYKFTQAVYKSMPQIFFKTYIMFNVSVYQGVVNGWVLSSILVSLVSITVVFTMVFDRKPARRLSMAAVRDQPIMAVWVADLFTCCGMGKDTANVKEFVNFDSYYTAHYCLSYVYQVAGLGSRALALAWWLATIDSGYESVVLFILFWVRAIVIFLHDRNAFSRTLYNNFILSLSLCVTDAAWYRDDADPESSRDIYIGLAVLSSVENCVGLLYAAFVHPDDTKISHHVNTGIFCFGLMLMIVRWGMLMYWALHVQFPELYVSGSNNNKRSSTRASASGSKSGAGTGGRKAATSTTETTTKAPKKIATKTAHSAAAAVPLLLENSADGSNGKGEKAKAAAGVGGGDGAILKRKKKATNNTNENGSNSSSSSSPSPSLQQQQQQRSRQQLQQRGSIKEEIGWKPALRSPVVAANSNRQGGGGGVGGGGGLRK